MSICSRGSTHAQFRTTLSDHWMHYAALAVGESNLTSVSDLALLTPSVACYGQLRQPKEAMAAKSWDHHDRTR